MTDYKAVIRLAQMKGFLKLTVDNIRHVQIDIALKEIACSYTKDSPIHKEIELITLTLIAKWLRDEHKIDVSSFPINKEVYGFCISFQDAMELQTENSDAEFAVRQMLYQDKKGLAFPNIEIMSMNKYTYEAALLEGINEALKLI